MGVLTMTEAIAIGVELREWALRRAAVCSKEGLDEIADLYRDLANDLQVILEEEGAT